MCTKIAFLWIFIFTVNFCSFEGMTTYLFELKFSMKAPNNFIIIKINNKMNRVDSDDDWSWHKNVTVGFGYYY